MGGNVLIVDEAYVRCRSRRAAVPFTLILVGMAAAGLVCEYMKADSTLRFVLGDTGAIVLMAIVVVALLALAPVTYMAANSPLKKGS